MRYIGLITTGRLTVLLFIASCEMDCAVLTIFKSMLQTDLKNILIEKVPILEILTVHSYSYSTGSDFENDNFQLGTCGIFF